MENHSYLICGLTVSFPWPQATLIKSTAKADVIVELGRATPPPKDLIKFNGPYCQAAPDHVFFDLDDIGRFSIRHGSNITVEILGDQDVEALNAFLLGSCLGVLLIQRNQLVLHAAVLEKNGRQVGFAGGPGSGKSTLSGLLLNSGGRILTDNIAAIQVEANAAATVFPSFPSLHLWRPTMEKLGLDDRNPIKLRPELDKYIMSFEEKFVSEPRPLHTLCILAPWNKSEICCERIDGIERITHLSHASFRLRITRGMEMDEQHFKHIGALSGWIELIKLSFPHDWALNKSLVEIVDELFLSPDKRRRLQLANVNPDCI